MTPSTTARARKQLGLTLTEALLVLAVASSVITAAYGAYKYAKSDVGANNLAQGAVQLATQAQSVFGGNGGYASVTPANVNLTGLIPSGWRWDGTAILDNNGNTVALSSAAGSLAIVIQNMSASECLKSVVQMEGAAYSIRLGAAATSAAGVISGGNVYKATTGLLTPASLATGCGEAGRKIALEVR